MSDKVKPSAKEKQKNFWTGFKDFITKGNIIDLAVAVVIGGAFNKIVSSLVNDIILPPIGLAIGGVEFDQLKYVLKPEVIDASGVVSVGEVAIRYGMLIQHILEFLIIAFCIYTVLVLIIRRRQQQQNLIDELIAQKAAEKAAALKAKEEQEKASELATQAKIEDNNEVQIKLLQEIRDALNKK